MQNGHDHRPEQYQQGPVDHDIIGFLSNGCSENQENSFLPDSKSEVTGASPHLAQPSSGPWQVGSLAGKRNYRLEWRERSRCSPILNSAYSRLSLGWAGLSEGPHGENPHGSCS